jgi:hypothetical protein
MAVNLRSPRHMDPSPESTDRTQGTATPPPGSLRRGQGVSAEVSAPYHGDGAIRPQAGLEPEQGRPREQVWLSGTVRALVGCFASQCFPNQSISDSVVDEAAEFILSQQRRMPDFLRLGILVATMLFAAWPIPRAGRVFSRLPEPSQWRQIRRWKSSHLSPFRDLMRFYESLTMFACQGIIYEHGRRDFRDDSTSVREDGNGDCRGGFGAGRRHHCLPPR